MAARILAFPKPINFPAVVESGPMWDIHWTSRDEVLQSHGVTEMDGAVIDAGLGCMRGTLRILMLEGLTAVVFYGVWQLAHLLS